MISTQLEDDAFATKWCPDFRIHYTVVATPAYTYTEWYDNRGNTGVLGTVHPNPYCIGPDCSQWKALALSDQRKGCCGRINKQLYRLRSQLLSVFYLKYASAYTL